MRARRPLVLVAVTTALAAVAVGCAGGGDDAAPTPPTVETLPTTTEPAGGCDLALVESVEPLPAGVDPGVAPTLPPGVDTGYAGSGGGSGNPYLVPGARPVPGPAMPVTTLGPDPLTVVVVAPPNPDVGSPPANPPGATTVPAPPTTLPPTAAPVPPSESTSTTGLMTLADDPGCVSSAGEP